MSNRPDFSDAESVEEVLITPQLKRRGAHARDDVRENEALIFLARTLSENPEQILQALVGEVLKLCRADSAGVSILERGGESGIFRWHAIAGEFSPNLYGTMPRGASPCGTVFDQDQTLLFDRPARFYAELRKAEPPIYEALLVPFHLGGKPIGAVWAVAHRSEQQFDAEDARLLENLSRFAGAGHNFLQRTLTNEDLRASRAAALNLMQDAVESRRAAESLNRDLQRQIAERNATQKALRESEALLSDEVRRVLKLYEASGKALAAPDLQSALEAILDASIKLLDADFGNIQLYDPESGELHIVAQRGFSKGFLETFRAVTPSDPSGCGRSIRSGRRVIIEDVQSDPEYVPFREIAAREGYRALQSTPIFERKGQLLGVISNHFRRPHRPAEADLRMLDLYAQKAVSLIVRNRAREALRQSEERFRQFAENSADVFWIVEAETLRVEYINPVYEKIFGQSREDLVQGRKKRMEVVHPDDREAAAAGLDRVRAGETFVRHYRIVRPNDGQTRWIRDTLFPIRDEKGRIIRIAGVAQDVTEDRQRSEALHESEERFRYLVEGAREYAIFLLDPSNTIIHWNSGAERIFGWSAEEAIGQSGRLIFTPEDRKKKQEEKEITIAMRSGRANDRRWHLRKDGTRIWVDGVMTRLEDAQTGALRGFAKIARDATAEREAQEELERRVAERTAELSQANQQLREQMEERTKLEQRILTISEREKRRIGDDLHDSLCQELAATAFFLESQAKKREKKHPAEATVFSEAARLVNANVGLARDLARGLHPVDLQSGGLAHALKELSFRVSQQRVSCRCECPERIRIKDQGVALNLYRIAAEAVGNALKHGKPRSITISLRRTRSALVLQVRDDGKGINSSPRRGMGLDIMHHRASVLGGHLEVESKPGRGTKVTCTLPRE